MINLSSASTYLISPPKSHIDLSSEFKTLEGNQGESLLEERRGKSKIICNTNLSFGRNFRLTATLIQWLRSSRLSRLSRPHQH